MVNLAASAQYWLPPTVAGVISVWVAVYLWRRRSAVAATALFILVCAVAEWALTSGLHKVVPGLSAKVLISKIQYLGIVATPLALLIFTALYTGRDRWVTRRTVALAAVLPLIMLAFVWTNGSHHLVWTAVKLDLNHPFPRGVYVHGPLFWAWVAVVYVVFLIATVWLLKSVVRSATIYRGQVVVLAIGIAAPWLANLLYVAKFNPWPTIDLTPIAFNITGLALAWGLYRFRISDIVPIARERVLENVPDAVFVLDERDRIVDLNPAAADILGRPAGEVVGRRADEALGPGAEIIARHREVSETSTEVIPDRNGTPHYYDFRVSPLNDRQGRLLGRLVILRDFTKRKRAEDELRRSEERHRVLFESAPDGIFIMDRQGVITDANDQLLATYARTRDEVIGHHSTDFISPRSREMFSRYFPRLADLATAEGEVDILRPDGEVVHLWRKCAPLADSLGKFVGVLAYDRNITQRRQAEVARLKEEKLGGVIEMAGAACHELNQPLQVAIGQVELMSMRMAAEDVRREKLDIILAQLEKLAEITSKIQKITKYETKDYLAAIKIIDIDTASEEE